MLARHKHGLCTPVLFWIESGRTIRKSDRKHTQGNLTQKKSYGKTMRNLRIVLVSIFVLTFSVNAEIINVPAEFESIQAGINASENGDTVLVQPGVYVENIDFIGKRITVGSMFLIELSRIFIEETVIDGNANGRVVNFRSGEQVDAVLIGFTIRNGNFGVGGGICCSSSNPTLSNLIVTGNTGTADGGGIGLYNSDPTLRDVVVTNNTTRMHGGGFFMSNSNPLILRSAIVGNFAGGHGGGMYIMDSNPILINVTLSSNTAEDDDGAIALSTSNPNMFNCIIWGNSPAEINGNGPRIIYSDIQGGFEGEGNINENPLFADPENGDYHLAANSPCIDTGNPEGDLDPDGTRVDMGAFHFHQRDIAVDPIELNFPPIGFGQLDSMSFTISNEGLTDLTIESIMGCRCGGCFWMNEFDQDLWEPIVIEPQQGVELWVYYRPEEGINRERTIFINSDDPDEPEVFVQANGEVNGIGEMDSEIPLTFTLYPPYPNPFNSATTISYTLPFQTNVSIEVYNTRGQLVDVLVDGLMSAGEHLTVWDGNGMSTGIYLVNMKTNGVNRFERVLLMK